MKERGFKKEYINMNWSGRVTGGLWGVGIRGLWENKGED